MIQYGQKIWQYQVKVTELALTCYVAVLFRLVNEELNKLKYSANVNVTDKLS